jgi:hypothetical protein
MEGYKVFEPDWTCRGFQYEVGKTFEEDVTPSCCNSGNRNSGNRNSGNRNSYEVVGGYLKILDEEDMSGT